MIGDPFLQVNRFNQWVVDELIYIDISTHQLSYAGRRDTANTKAHNYESLVRCVGEQCRVPLLWGGNLRSTGDAARAISLGADKVLFTSAAELAPWAIVETAQEFGSQAVSVGLDFRRESGSLRLFIDGARVPIDRPLKDQLQRVVDLGAGEIVLHAVDRDGTGVGYDLDVVGEALSVVDVPVTILGGARTPNDLVDGALAGASCVAAANMWHFSENVDVDVRREMLLAGIGVRRA